MEPWACSGRQGPWGTVRGVRLGVRPPLLVALSRTSRQWYGWEQNGSLSSPRIHHPQTAPFCNQRKPTEHSFCHPLIPQNSSFRNFGVYPPLEFVISGCKVQFTHKEMVRSTRQPELRGTLAGKCFSVFTNQISYLKYNPIYTPPPWPGASYSTVLSMCLILRRNHDNKHSGQICCMKGKFHKNEFSKNEKNTILTRTKKIPLIKKMFLILEKETISNDNRRKKSDRATPDAPPFFLFLWVNQNPYKRCFS